MLARGFQGTKILISIEKTLFLRHQSAHVSFTIAQAFCSISGQFVVNAYSTI